MTSIYLIGSLRNPKVRELAADLREAGHDVFDDWHSAGPNADDEWQKYEQDRKRPYHIALHGLHAETVFALDKTHLDRCQVGVLLLPAGKSGHLELGYMLGRGKRGYVFLPEAPERFDIMYKLATRIVSNVDELILLLDNGEMDAV